MKNKFILMAFGLLLLSCSKDDSNNTSDNTEEVIVDEGGTTPTVNPDFLQDTNGNFWVYETQSTQGNGRDSLYIANDTVINTTTYKKYKTAQPATGFYTTMLTGGAVRKADGKVIITGELSINTGLGLPINISLNNFVIYDKNAAANQELSSNNGTLTQNIQGMDISIAYILKSQSKETIGTYTAVPGKIYTNVKPVEMRLNVQVTVNYNGFPFPLLPMQDVLVSTQYYTEDAGAVHVTSDLSYDFTDVSALGFELPVPQSGTAQQQETLVNHNID